MNKALITGIIVVVVVVGGVLFLQNKAGAPTNETENVTPNPTPSPTPSPTETPSQSPSPTPTPTSTAPVEIVYTDNGYSPAEVTIKKGQTVTFKNSSTKTMWPASAPHPTHTDYAAFDPKKAIAMGESWSFTFDQVGAWAFHDHLNSTKFGKITVTE
jgi:plastocyanin